MLAVSNPCIIDKTLAPEGYIVVHVYRAGNKPFGVWEGLDRRSNEYKLLKEERANALWRAVESIIPYVWDQVVLEMIGSPITHKRFLQRPSGTYGSATEDYLKDGSTPFATFVLWYFPGYRNTRRRYIGSKCGEWTGWRATAMAVSRQDRAQRKAIEKPKVKKRLVLQ